MKRPLRRPHSLLQVDDPQHRPAIIFVTLVTFVRWSGGQGALSTGVSKAVSGARHNLLIQHLREIDHRNLRDAAGRVKIREDSHGIVALRTRVGRNGVRSEADIKALVNTARDPIRDPGTLAARIFG